MSQKRATGVFTIVAIHDGTDGQDMRENIVDNSEPMFTRNVADIPVSQANGWRYIGTDKVLVVDKVPADGGVVSGQMRVTLSGCSFNGTGNVFLYFQSMQGTTGKAWPAIAEINVTENGTYEVKTEGTVINRNGGEFGSPVILRLQNFNAVGSITIERVKLEVADKCSEWCLSENDKRGTNGYNTAVVSLYQRYAPTQQAATPALPNSTLYYKFSTGKLYTDAACTTEATAQIMNGWTQTTPAAAADTKLFITQATARSQEASDAIAANEWTGAVELVTDGTSPYFADIDNEMGSVACDANGDTTSAYDVYIGVHIWHGSVEQTLTKLQTNSITGFTITPDATNKRIRIQVASGTQIEKVNNITITIASANSGDKTLHFTLNGVRPGANGEPATIYELIPSINVIQRDSSQVPLFDEMTFIAQKVVGNTITNLETIQEWHAEELSLYYDDGDGETLVGESYMSEGDRTLVNYHDIESLYDSHDGNIAWILKKGSIEADKYVVDKEGIGSVDDGSNGNPGLNSAPVILYQRYTPTTQNPTPAKPNSSAFYQFSNGKLYTTASGSTETAIDSNKLNGWTRTIPSGSAPIFTIQATASNTTARDEITSSEWSDPVKYVENGAAGKDAQYIYLKGTARDADNTELEYINSVINVNGGNSLITALGRGLNLVTINRQTLAKVESINYDTYGEAAGESGKTGITDLIAKLAALDNSVFVCLVSFDAVGWQRPADATAGTFPLITALQGFGMGDLPYTDAARHPFLFIGYKDLGKGNGLMRMRDVGAYTDVAELSVYVANGALSSHDGEPGKDGWMITANPANVIITQNLVTTSTFTTATVSFTAKKGNVAATIESIGTPTSSEFNVAKKGVSGDDAKKVLVSSPKTFTPSGSSSTEYYTEGSFTVQVNVTDPDTNTTVVFDVVVPCYANLLGKWTQTIEDGVETSVATKLGFVDPSTGVYSIQYAGTYIRGWAENTSILTQKVNNGKNLLKVTSGWEDFNGDTSSISYTNKFGVLDSNNDLYSPIVDLQANTTYCFSAEFDADPTNETAYALAPASGTYTHNSDVYDQGTTDFPSWQTASDGRKYFTFTTGNAACKFVFNQYLNNYNNNIYRPQLELGSVSTPFEASTIEVSSKIQQTADEIDLSIRSGLNNTGINITTGKVAVEADNFTVGKNGTQVFGVDANTGVTTMQDVDIKGSLMYHKTIIDNNNHYIKNYQFYDANGTPVSDSYSGTIASCKIPYDTIVIGGTKRISSYTDPIENVVVDEGFRVILPPAKFFVGMRIRIINCTIASGHQAASLSPSRLDIGVVYREDLDEIYTDGDGGTYAFNFVAAASPLSVDLRNTSTSTRSTFVGAPDTSVVNLPNLGSADKRNYAYLVGDKTATPVRYREIELVSQQNPYTSGGYAWIIIDTQQ